jgi:hypothetical protein
VCNQQANQLFSHRKVRLFSPLDVRLGNLVHNLLDVLVFSQVKDRRVNLLNSLLFGHLDSQR